MNDSAVLMDINKSLAALAQGYQTLEYTAAMLLCQLSPLQETDEPSCANASPEFKERLIALYKLRDAENQSLVRCQITGELMQTEATVAAHLFPRQAAVSGII